MGPLKSLDDGLGDHYGDRLLSGCRDPTHSRKLERAAGPKERGLTNEIVSNQGGKKKLATRKLQKLEVVRDHKNITSDVMGYVDGANAV